MSKTIKRALFGLLALAFLAALVLPFAGLRADAAAVPAEQAEEQTQEEQMQEGQAAEPRLFTSLTLALSGGDGYGNIYATMQNHFELFSPVVPVIISLYSSPYAGNDPEKMTLEATAFTEDLDKGESLSAIGNTRGRQLYWYGVAEYRENSGDWKTVEVGPILYDAWGYHIEM